ncbi:MAG TPA: cupin domain-containing protein [Longimicrobium sp.]|nr:cupin domain-containing protein [Longimicrobium sp.]
MSDTAPAQTPLTFTFDLGNAPKTVDVPGGTIQEAKRSDFSALQDVAIFLLTLEGGALRVPHWHPDAGELDYVISGNATIGLAAPDGTPASVAPQWQTLSVGPGQLAFLPRGWYHYIQNASPTEPLQMLVIFTNAEPSDIGIAEAFSGTPAALLAQTFGVGASTFQGLQFGNTYIAAAPGTSR